MIEAIHASILRVPPLRSFVRRQHRDSVRIQQRFAKVFGKHFERALRSSGIIYKNGNLNQNLGSPRGVSIGVDTCAFAAREIATIRTGFEPTDAYYDKLRANAYAHFGLDRS
jgi:hypothetical protein